MKKTGNVCSIFAAAAALVFFLSALPAQLQAEDEWQYWNEFALKKKISEDWTLGLKNEMWLYDDLHELGLVNFDVGLDWKVSKYLVIGPHFKYEHENRTSGTHVNENRWYPEATLKYSWKNIGLSSRSRMEYRNKNTTDSWRYRNMFKISCPLPFEKLKMSVYAADEIFWEISDSSFNQNRVRVGTAFHLQKHVDLNVYYLIKSTRAGTDWNDIQVMGTSLTVSL